MGSNGQPEKDYVFAAVAYANALPLAHFIPQVCARARVVEDLPSRLLAPLLAGEVDAALVPVAAYLGEPALAMIDGLGICARRKVRSVLLRCNRPIARVRTVAADSASRTSNALAAILLREKFGMDVQFVHPPGLVTAKGNSAQPDAAVVIGDRALCTPPGACGDVDLAEQWNEWTGLPFVFAVWAYRRGRGDADELARIAHAARKAGAAALDALAAMVSTKLNLSLPACRDYFQSCIHYEVGPREREAMALFGQWLRKSPSVAPPPGPAAGGSGAP